MKRIQDLSWKQKNRLLAVSLLFMMWFVYSHAIANTLEAKSECEKLQKEILGASQAPAQIKELEKELQHLDQITGQSSNVMVDSSIHEQLLNLVTVYCGSHDLVLREFSFPIRYVRQEWLIETHPFTVEGNYIDIVQLLDYLRTNAPGKVVSSDIYSKQDSKTKVTSLLVTIYIQNISTTST